MNERARSGTAPDFGSAQKLLFELQVEQHHHDEHYHREIARLSLHHRLNHMALHFAKYSGKVAAASDIAGAQTTFVDTLIIALSTANALNVELWEHLDSQGQDYPGLLPFGRAIAVSIPEQIESHTTVMRSMATGAGKIAAACEKIDHLEEISFRSEIRASIVALASLSLAVLAVQGVDPAQAVRDRLAGVKKRLKLHGRV